MLIILINSVRASDVIRDDELREISDYLGKITHQVELRNCIQLYDINTVAEEFYKELLNLVFDLNLVNLNAAEPNTKAIDLGDKAKKHSVQVTSEKSIKKIKDTVRKFEEDNRQNDYDLLTIQLLRIKSKYTSLPKTNGYELVVQDHTDLIKYINKLSTTKISAIRVFLEKELDRDANKRREADQQIIDTFSSNAAQFISDVAVKIVAAVTDEDTDMGLDDHELKAKFRKMKCTTTYRRSFDRHALFFPVIDEIITTDSIKGGANTIRAIIGLIKNIYYKMLDRSPNGDQIHADLLGSIIQDGFKSEEIIATEVLIFYTINQCGIFNEEK